MQELTLFLEALFYTSGTEEMSNGYSTLSKILSIGCLTDVFTLPHEECLHLNAVKFPLEGQRQQHLTGLMIQEGGVGDNMSNRSGNIYVALQLFFKILMLGIAIYIATLDTTI